MMNNCCNAHFSGWPFSSSSNGFSASSETKNSTKFLYCFAFVILPGKRQPWDDRDCQCDAPETPREKKKNEEKKWWDRGPCFFFWQLSMPEQTIHFHWIYKIFHRVQKIPPISSIAMVFWMKGFFPYQKSLNLPTFKKNSALTAKVCLDLLC